MYNFRGITIIIDIVYIIPLALSVLYSYSQHYEGVNTTLSAAACSFIKTFFLHKNFSKHKFPILI